MFSNTVLTDGIVRWVSNNRVPPNDLLELWRHCGRPFDYDASLSASIKETTDTIKQYRETSKLRQHTPEELAEMRANFGEGEEVVNVLTGEVTYL